MPTFSEMLQRIRAEIREEDPEQIRQRLVAGEALVLLDVRERDEYVDGHAEGCIFLPRSFVDMRIESVVPDHDTPIVAYCAGGTRSALVAHTLGQLGYTNVVSLVGGFPAWRGHGMPTRTTRLLTDRQRERYSRHLRLSEVGEEGQLRLLDARVLLVGVGGLGSPAALYLAAAGVGTLGIIDDDRVDRSNLQRQVLHDDARVGDLKVESAKAALARLNPDISVTTFPERLTDQNVDQLFAQGWDVVVDGGDNFATRYLVNDACLRHGIDLVHGSVHQFEGQLSVFLAKSGPCYRCLFPEPPGPGLAPNCAEAGVLGVLPGVIGVMQATEAIKLVLGIGQPASGRLIIYDAREASVRELRLSADPKCVCAGRKH
ncbi:MAG: molybdopterin-synthase adenylyltransferase MoeB [bacterium]